MAYPNNTEISNAASTLGVDPIEVYAYAAMHGRVPATRDDLTTLEVAVQNAPGFFVPGLGEPIAYRFGYIQANGGFPVASWQYTNWLTTHGYATKDAATGTIYLSGSYPFAGEGYPPGNQPTNPTQPTTSPQQPPPTGGFDLGSLVKNPFVLGGAALVGAWMLGIFPRRR